MGPNLAGEDFSDPIFLGEHSGQKRRGRPPSVNAERLRQNVIELQFALEQNWGVAGWLLWQAKTTADIRTALRNIVNPRCRLLEPFTKDQTRNTTPTELRNLRKRLGEATQRHRDRFTLRKQARNSCELAFKAWVAESEPVRRAQIQAIRRALAQDYLEAETLDERSSQERESLQAELEEREAHFAQSQLLSFIQSNRRQFTPQNIARAIAGLPFVTARVSCERCTALGVNPLHGVAFDMFLTIERVLKDPIRDLGGTLEAMRKHLLNDRGRKLPHMAQLRKTWYFLESAIRSEGRNVHAPRGSVAFRVFAEYCRTSGAHSAAESVLARVHRLLLEDEGSDEERGPNLLTP